jgi:hypothetical protein
MKLKLLLASIALATAGSAMAKTEDLGTLGPPGYAEFKNTFSSGQSFSDTYTFTLDGNANGIGGVFDFDLSYGMHLDLTSVSLSGTGIAGSIFDYTPLDFSFGNLVAGSYSLVVSGVVTGNPLNAKDGNVWYEGTLTTVAAPVPEPETIAMMALGLGVVGGIARRRKAQAK